MFSKPNIDLFIVGAAKAGTTSLYNYLGEHPDVFFPLVKEPNFYSRAEAHNPTAYVNPKKGKFYHNKIIRDKKLYFSLYEGSQSFKIVGDASPSYLWDLKTAQKIKADFPSTKIIILLRDPVQRAFSQFLMDLKDGNQQQPDFLKALKNDKKQKLHVWGRAHLYEELGLYYQQVKQYMDTFPKENVKILLYEEYITDTKKALLGILDFLDLDQSHINTINHGKIHNPYMEPKNRYANVLLGLKKKTGVFKQWIPSFIKNSINNKILFKEGKKPLIPKDAEDYLKQIFSEDVEKLSVLIEKDLRKWKK